MKIETPNHNGGPYRIPHTHRVSTPFFGRAFNPGVRARGVALSRADGDQRFKE